MYRTCKVCKNQFISLSKIADFYWKIVCIEKYLKTFKNEHENILKTFEYITDVFLVFSRNSILKLLILLYELKGLILSIPNMFQHQLLQQCLGELVYQLLTTPVIQSPLNLMDWVFGCFYGIMTVDYFWRKFKLYFSLFLSVTKPKQFLHNTLFSISL